MVSEHSEKSICAPPRLRSFPNVAFETVAMFVRLTMALSRPFMNDRPALPLSTPLSSRRLMVWCPWLCPRSPVQMCAGVGSALSRTWTSWVISVASGSLRRFFSWSSDQLCSLTKTDSYNCIHHDQLFTFFKIFFIEPRRDQEEGGGAGLS